MKLNKTRRIILNTLATYGRSVFAMLAGVFSSRWLLMGLGAEDLGLQCTVGSMIGAIVILETVMQVAVARFYAYAFGESQRFGGETGADEIRRWFNVVLLIHLAFPLLVLVIGYPIGLYAVQHWLTIPAARVEACAFVYNCSCVMFLVSTLATPYIAMYEARQEIVELSFYSVARTIINLGFTFSLLYVTCDKLIYSALFGAGVSIVVLSIQVYRARILFPECRISIGYLWDFSRLKRIFIYFFWEIFSCTGNMTKQQGSAIVINKCFGPATNASWQIANTLSAQASALSGALMGALLPAVTAEEGAGERTKMLGLALRSSKFGSLLILIFSIPLIAEMDEVLRLWLVTPPPQSGRMCSCILIAYALDKLGLGHHVAISANGKIGFYHSIVGTTFFLSIPISLGFVWLGCGPCSVGYMFVVLFMLISSERVLLARHLVGMSVRRFLSGVLFPLGLMSVMSYAASYGVTCLLPPSFGRICLTTAVALIVMSAIAWPFLLDSEERGYIVSGFSKIKIRLPIFKK